MYKKNFPSVDSFIVFGGGPVFLYFARQVKKMGYPLLAVTSERHAAEIIVSTGRTLRELLDEERVSVRVSPNVNTDTVVKDAITHSTMAMSICGTWIFKSDFIDLFQGRLFNLHGSRLPQNRGGGGVSWQILSGHAIGGAAIHQLDPGIDTGDIILSREFVFPPSCVTPEEHEVVVHAKSREMLDEFLTRIKNREDFNYQNQQENLSTYWPRLSTDVHGFVDWSWSLRNIDVFIRAFDHPYKGASTFLHGERVFLRGCFVSTADGSFHPFQKGIIFRKADHVLYVATETGTLIIPEILDASGLSVYDRVQAGDRLYTPVRFLEEAKLTRVIYTPEGPKKKTVE